jgi:hypothetical protein
MSTRSEAFKRLSPALTFLYSMGTSSVRASVTMESARQDRIMRLTGEAPNGSRIVEELPRDPTWIDAVPAIRDMQQAADAVLEALLQSPESVGVQLTDTEG